MAWQSSDSLMKSKTSYCIDIKSEITRTIQVLAKVTFLYLLGRPFYTSSSFGWKKGMKRNHERCN